MAEYNQLEQQMYGQQVQSRPEPVQHHPQKLLLFVGIILAVILIIGAFFVFAPDKGDEGLYEYIEISDFTQELDESESFTESIAEEDASIDKPIRIVANKPGPPYEETDTEIIVDLEYMAESLR